VESLIQSEMESGKHHHLTGKSTEVFTRACRPDMQGKMMSATAFVSHPLCFLAPLSLFSNSYPSCVQINHKYNKKEVYMQVLYIYS
jgi:hypothetical protein